MKHVAHIVVDRKCRVHNTHMWMYVRIKKGRRYLYTICHHCDKERKIKLKNNETRIAKQDAAFIPS